MNKRGVHHPAGAAGTIIKIIDDSIHSPCVFKEETYKQNMMQRRYGRPRATATNTTADLEPWMATIVGEGKYPG
jgi:hypothetical protein